MRAHAPVCARHVVQMGGKNHKLFDDFVKLCCVAFNTVRKHIALVPPKLFMPFLTDLRK